MWLPALPLLPFQSVFWQGITCEGLGRLALFLNTRYLSLSHLQFFSLSQRQIPPYLFFCVLGKSCWNQWICHPETCFRIGLFPLPACFLVYFTSSISLWISCSYIKKEISLQVTLVNSYPHMAIFSGRKAHSAFCYLTSCENDAWVPGCWYRTLIDRAVFNLIKRLFLWWWAAAFAASQNGMSLACCS